jgi:hypothetical protein
MIQYFSISSIKILYQEIDIFDLMPLGIVFTFALQSKYPKRNLF